MSHRRTVLALVAITVSASFGLASAADLATNPVQPAYGFKTGEDVVYKLSVLVEWPTEKLPLTGYSIYHIHSANSAGYITFTHSAKLSPPVGAEELIIPDGPPVRSYFAECDVMINLGGEKVSRVKKEPLPYLLGEAWSLLVPWVGDSEFSRGIDTHWDVGSQGPDIPVLDPYHPEQLKSFHGAYNPSSVETTADKSIVNLTYNIDINDMKVSGNGRRVWDLQRGRVESFELKAVITIPDDRGQKQVPITVSASIAAPEEAKKYLDDLHARWQEEEKSGLRQPTTSRATMPTPRDDNTRRFGRENMELTEPGPAPLAQAIVILKKARSSYDMARACDKLAESMPVFSLRDQVVKTLLPLLADRDHNVRWGAADALGVWGSPAEIPAMKAAIKDEDDDRVQAYLKDAMREINQRGEIVPPKPGSPEETTDRITAQAVQRELEMQRMAIARKAATQRTEVPPSRQLNARRLVREHVAREQITPAELEVAIAKLKRTRSESDVEVACRKLAKSKAIDGRRDEVAKALVPLLADRDDSIRLYAADALGVWGSPAEIPAMKAALQEEDSAPLLPDYLIDAISEIMARGEIRPTKPASASAPVPKPAPAAPVPAATTPPPAAKPTANIVYER